MPRIKIEKLPQTVELTEEELLELYGAGKPGFRPGVEALEGRDLMAASLSPATLIVPPPVDRVSGASAGVAYGIDAQGDLQRYFDATGWHGIGQKELPAIKALAVGPDATNAIDQVFAQVADNTVYKLQGESLVTTGRKVVSMQAGVGTVYGLDDKGSLLVYQSSTKAWQATGIVAKAFSVGKDAKGADMVMAQTKDNLVWYNTGPGKWTSTKMTMISFQVGQGEAFGLNSAGKLNRFTPQTGWKDMGQSGKAFAIGKLSAAGQDLVFLQKADNSIIYFEGTWKDTGGGKLTQIQAAKGQVFGLDSKGVLFRFDTATRQWTDTGKVGNFVLGTNAKGQNEVYLKDVAGTVWDYDNGAWTSTTPVKSVAGGVTGPQVSPSGQETIYAINSFVVVRGVRTWVPPGTVSVIVPPIGKKGIEVDGKGETLPSNVDFLLYQGPEGPNTVRPPGMVRYGRIGDMPPVPPVAPIIVDPWITVVGGNGIKVDFRDNGTVSKIMRVTGTTAADRIILRRTVDFSAGAEHANTMRVDGVIGAWDADQIYQIEIFGAGGDDVIDASSSDPGLWQSAINIPMIITAGQGVNWIKSGGGDDIIYGHAFRDIIYSGYGNDSVFGQAGNDAIYAGAGNDWVQGGIGDDWIEGDAGNDYLEGGAGNDYIQDSGTQPTEAGATENDTILGDAGDDTILGGVGDDRLEGGLGSNWLNGQEGNDVIGGGELGDTIYGGDGDDRIWGFGGNDLLIGGKGDDTLLGGEGNDEMYGESGNDVLHGGAGTDKLKGGTDQDIVVGGTGGDWLYEGGDDVLVGGDLTVGEDVAQLRQLLNTWMMQGTFEQRVSNLINGGLASNDDGATDYVAGIKGVTLRFVFKQGPTPDMIQDLPNQTSMGGQASLNDLVGTWDVTDFSQERMGEGKFRYTMTIDQIYPPNGTTPTSSFRYTVNGVTRIGQFYQANGMVYMQFRFANGDRNEWQIGAKLIQNAEGKWVISGYTKVLGQEDYLKGWWDAVKQ